MADYLNIDEVETAVENLATAYPAIATLITLPNQTFENRTSHALRIGAGAAGSRDVVMLVGGHHAREWGSCDILINFAADLLDAYNTNSGLAYGPKTFTAAQLQTIVDELHVVVFPLVNPDGRRYSQDVDVDWRRNRNPAYSGGNAGCIGVDLNRNYDFLWDYKNKFDSHTYSDPMNLFPIQVSDDPCNAVQLYHGPAPFSEPETRNVRWLLDMFPRTRWFVDVHSWRGQVLHSWGDDDNQDTDPTKNFRNPAFDSARGMKNDVAYKEYMRTGDLAVESSLATRVRDAIAAVRGQTYVAGPSFSTLYPTSGTSQDYAYSRHLTDPSKAKAYGFTIEWSKVEFQPPWPEMELIVGEITAGLLELCVSAKCAGGLVAVSLDTPSLKFLDVPAGAEAVRAVVFTVESCSAVEFTAQVPTPSPPFALYQGGLESLPAAPTAAPRQVRVWVSYQSNNPMDVSNGTITIHCEPTGVDYHIPITANTVAPPRVASVLVLDKSASMADPSGIPATRRIDVLHQAAPAFVDLLPDDHGIGLVAFDHNANEVMPVTQADLGGRGQATTFIANHQPNPAGNTAIGDGVETAHTTLNNAVGYAGRASVVFTDGHETAAKYIADVAGLIDERVFAVGLGTAQQLNPVALNHLVNDREGYLLLTGDLGGDDDLRVDKYFSQIQAGVSNEEVVVDPEGTVRPGDTLRIPFVITEADRTATVFVLSGAPWAIDFALETPDGDVIDPGAAAMLPAIEFRTAARVHHYRMTFPVPVGAGAHIGKWHAVLSITKDSFKKWAGSNKPGGSQASAAHGVPFSLNVHATSGVKMNTRVEQSGLVPGSSLVVRTVLTESGVTMAQQAFVVADVDRPDGTSVKLTMAEVEPGVFEGATSAIVSGIYPIRVKAIGTTRRGSPFTREALRTAAVWRGGNGEPPSSQPTGPGKGTGGPPDWCHLADCLLGQESIIRWLERQKIDVDELRRCLEKSCET